MYKVKFADVNLDEYCLITNVHRSLLPPRTNFSKEVPVLNGSYYTGYKYGVRTIELDIVLLANNKEDYMQSVSTLADILNVDRPSELIIDDEPWKRYFAVVEGDLKLTKVSQSGKVTLKFVCYDPIAESMYWNSYTPDENGVIELQSYGNANTYPVIDIDFNNPGCFIQVTNPEGQTVLVGRPKDSTKTNVKNKTEVINDNCEDSTTFSTLPPSLIDNNATAEGSYSVSSNGIVCLNYGNTVDGKWTGTAFKRNLDRDLTDFEVTVDLTFSSQGKNYAPPKPTPPVTVKPAPTPPNKPGHDATQPPSNCLGTYKVTAVSGLWINREANTKHRLHAMSNGEVVYPVEKKGDWYKHTKTYKNGKSYTGWSYGKYLKKVSNTTKRKRKKNTKMSTKFSFGDNNVDNSFAESQLGKIQVFGFDKNGVRLFWFELTDTSEYYEYVKPKLYIGTKKVLDDGKTLSAPRKVSIKDEHGKVTKENAASGTFGNFNDFDGKFIIKRERNSKGTQLWTASIKKISNGKVVQNLSLKNAISGSSYPNTDLNYIGFFIGRYSQYKPVDVIRIKNVAVKQMNVKTDQTVNDNLQIFNSGDHLHMDFETGQVLLNDQNLLPHLDIGSEFFTIPPDYSEILVRTDAADSGIICGFKDKFI